MKLHYYTGEPNFGDALNEWLWEELLPGYWDPSDGIFFSGIGTILNGGMPKAKHWVVFTSGVGYGKMPERLGSSGWTIFAVRGPMTAQALGLPAKLAITDGALLIASLKQYKPLPEAERASAVFVPHHRSENLVGWSAICERAGVEYLSPRLDSRQVVERIRRAKLVLADAMHAAIIADALRVPWIPMVSSPEISTFKWLDWSRSMDVPYRPIRIPPSSIASWIHNSVLWTSASDHVFLADTEEEALARFRRRNRLLEKRWWPAVRRQAKRGQKLVDLVAGAPLLRRTGPIRAIDEVYLDRAAAVLSNAARNKGFLSSEGVFRDRLDSLLSQLTEIKRIPGVHVRTADQKSVPANSATPRLPVHASK